MANAEQIQQLRQQAEGLGQRLSELDAAIVSRVDTLYSEYQIEEAHGEDYLIRTAELGEALQQSSNDPEIGRRPLLEARLRGLEMTIRIGTMVVEGAYGPIGDRIFQRALEELETIGISETGSQVEDNDEARELNHPENGEIKQVVKFKVYSVDGEVEPVEIEMPKDQFEQEVNLVTLNGKVIRPRAGHPKDLINLLQFIPPGTVMESDDLMVVLGVNRENFTTIVYSTNQYLQRNKIDGKVRNILEGSKRKGRYLWETSKSAVHPSPPPPGEGKEDVRLILG